MKKYKLISTLFYVAAVLYYLAAIITFVSGNHNSTGIMWLCLGSAILCFGSVFLNKSKDNDNDAEDK